LREEKLSLQSAPGGLTTTCAATSQNEKIIFLQKKKPMNQTTQNHFSSTLPALTNIKLGRFWVFCLAS